MKKYNKILEAINSGIKFALDDFEDNEEIQGQTNSKVSHKHGTNEYINLIRNTVDFGLPSGNLWYKYNLGVTNPTEIVTLPEDWYGNYYAWGETTPKDDYNESSYKFSILTYLNNITIAEYTKYCHDIEDGYKGYTDNLTLLELEDDAVHIKLGKNIIFQLLKILKNYLNILHKNTKEIIVKLKI